MRNSKRLTERLTDERIRQYVARFAGPAGLTTAQIARGLGVEPGFFAARLHACDGLIFEKRNSRTMLWRVQ